MQSGRWFVAATLKPCNPPTERVKRRGMFLEKRVSNRARAAIILVLCLLPAIFVASQFTYQHGLTRLLDVNPTYLPRRALPQFQALNPATLEKKGYDGQFYAQLAIDPLLRNPQLARALDGPEYRARRILMPAIAWLLGAGRPAAAVTIYTLLNLAAWYVLFTLLARSQRPLTVQAWLCIAAIMLTAGAFASLARSLTDLPAAALLVAAAVLAGWSRTLALALSALTKEAYLLCAWAPIPDLPKQAHKFPLRIIHVAAIVLPWLLWAIYVHLRFAMPAYGTDNFSWPFEGWLFCIISAIREVKVKRALAALSLLVQFGYLVSRPQFKSFYWRTAITFGIVGALLTDDPFASEISFTRDLLPMTIGFNILLIQEKPMRFLFWFPAGNAGLFISLIGLIISMYR